MLPLLLLLILGAMQVGVALIARYELGHAVTEAAIAGASESRVPERCPTALAALATVYGRATQDAACIPAVGTALQVTARINLSTFVPGLTNWPIKVTARAVIR